jgi:endonuclease-3 related protein
MAGIVQKIRGLYDSLWSLFGAQGWWPLPAKAGKAGFDDRGYHRSRYSDPRNATDRFAVCLGAILTQNTAWSNAESALLELSSRGWDEPEVILNAVDIRELAESIRSSGYFNQKAKKIRALSRFLAEGDYLSKGRAPVRDDILSVWGIGPETADSILLYAFHEPSFVIDAYTRRLTGRLGIIAEDVSYDNVKSTFTRALPLDAELFNEYHALIVRFCKEHCAAKPGCGDCPKRGSCPAARGYMQKGEGTKGGRRT